MPTEPKTEAPAVMSQVMCAANTIAAAANLLTEIKNRIAGGDAPDSPVAPEPVSLTDWTTRLVINASRAFNVAQQIAENV